MQSLGKALCNSQFKLILCVCHLCSDQTGLEFLHVRRIDILSLSLLPSISLALLSFYKGRDCFAVTLRCSEEVSLRNRKAGGFSDWGGQGYSGIVNLLNTRARTHARTIPCCSGTLRRQIKKDSVVCRKRETPRPTATSTTVTQREKSERGKRSERKKCCAALAVWAEPRIQWPLARERHGCVCARESMCVDVCVCNMWQGCGVSYSFHTHTRSPLHQSSPPQARAKRSAVRKPVCVCLWLNPFRENNPFCVCECVCICGIACACVACMCVRVLQCTVYCVFSSMINQSEGRRPRAKGTATAPTLLTPYCPRRDTQLPIIPLS